MTIKTYQDLIALGDNEAGRMQFVLDLIREHKSSPRYRIAADAEAYCDHENPTIMRYQKFVYNQFGQKVPDVWSANNKVASNWYNYFTTQAVQYLLGNGVNFNDKATKGRLGKEFDKRMQDAATYAKNGGQAFVFWNADHVDVFSFLEFAPIYDEEDGSMKAGARFWQVDETKPMRVTLYELDGKTEYIKRPDEDIKVYKEKAAYIINGQTSEADGDEILDAQNYPSFPIVPLWNVNHKSDIAGNQGTIDAYDLMISGLVNNVSEGEFIYWILKNFGGMDDLADTEFYEQLRTKHMAHVGGDGENAEVDAHTVNVPFEATAEALDRLEKQLFKDFMALRVDDISAGATNDQIQAAYEPLNQKTDKFEYCVTAAIKGILAVAGIDDEPTYTRSQMSNRKETLDMVLQSAQYLPEEYVTRKIMTLLGDADQVEEILQQMVAEESDRFTGNKTNENTESEDE